MPCATSRRTRTWRGVGAARRAEPRSSASPSSDSSPRGWRCWKAMWAPGGRWPRDMKRAIFINSADNPSVDDLGLFADAGYYTVLIGLDEGAQFLREAASEFGIDLPTSWLLGRT